MKLFDLVNAALPAGYFLQAQGRASFDVIHGGVAVARIDTKLQMWALLNAVEYTESGLKIGDSEVPLWRFLVATGKLP